MDIKTLCLGALSINESSGYDIKKLFEAAFSHFQNASFGSIYPSLKKLKEEGAVTDKIQEGEKRPDKRLFKLTQKGKERFINELINTPSTESIKSDFLVLLFFSHHLTKSILEEKLSEIEDHYNSKLLYLQSMLPQKNLTPGMKFGIEQGIASYSAKIEHLKKNKKNLLEENKKVKIDKNIRFKNV
tara:strand:- start:85 stop:642 length:558 start_codon:yes stop_codon:yes gene_type:complete